MARSPVSRRRIRTWKLVAATSLALVSALPAGVAHAALPVVATEGCHASGPVGFGYDAPPQRLETLHCTMAPISCSATCIASGWVTATAAVPVIATGGWLLASSPTGTVIVASCGSSTTSCTGADTTGHAMFAGPQTFTPDCSWNSFVTNSLSLVGVNATVSCTITIAPSS